MEGQNPFVEVEARQERWKYLTDGLQEKYGKYDLDEGRHRRICVEILLDNAAWMLETTTSTDIAAAAPYIFPMVRRIFPKLIANELVSVQPMSRPDGKVFYLDFYRNADPGTLGDRVDLSVDEDYADRDPGGEVAEVSFKIASESVTAKQKALKAKWEIELQQDLKAYHGEDAETMLMGVTANEIVRETDQEIILNIADNVGAGNVNWVYTVPASGAYSALDPKVYKETLYDAITDANNLIFKKVFRNATWIVADPDTCARLEKLEKFKLFEGADAQTENIGVIRFGTLAQKYKVYKHPWFTANKILLGYKGSTWVETGYVYAPYIPLWTTPVIIDPNDFTPRRGVMTRFAKKMVNGDFFSTVTLQAS
jgi:hypothetical protein